MNLFTMIVRRSYSEQLAPRPTPRRFLFDLICALTAGENRYYSYRYGSVTKQYNLVQLTEEREEFLHGHYGPRDEQLRVCEFCNMTQ